MRFYSTKSLPSDQESCCRALPLFAKRCGPPSFWFVLPAILPSPPFLSLLPLVMSSLYVLVCALLLILVCCCCCVGQSSY
jgi:hypothetical protein